MSALPANEDFARLAAQIKQTKALAQSDSVSRVLASDTTFATIAFGFEKTRPIQEKRMTRSSERVQQWGWEGIDEDKIVVGYLSHNGQRLRFQTKEATVFDASLRDLQVEEHGLGLQITIGGKQYIIGNFMAVNDVLSPSEKMKTTFGGQATIWMRELADLGVINKDTYKKTQINKKRFLLIFYSIVILLSALLIIYGDN